MDELHRNILFLSVFIMVSIPASIIDVKYRIIPDWCVISGSVILFFLRLYISRDVLLIISLDMFSGPFIFMMIRLISRGKLGMGDVKFSALMGLFLGFPGWFAALSAASFLGLLFAAAGCIAGALNKTSRIPFAPFLTAGSIGVYLLTPLILRNTAVYPW